jgi:tRNA(adenine34) deaminase
MLSEDIEWMRLALAEAETAASHADVPIGCVVVDGAGVLVGRGENRRESAGDPTAHAEVVAMRSAAARRGHWRLDDCTLFVTLEPCPMCAGALVNARVRRLVFGALDEKAGAVVSGFGIGTGGRLNHRYEWTPGVLAEESVALLRAFFQKLREEGQK